MDAGVAVERLGHLHALRPVASADTYNARNAGNTNNASNMGNRDKRVMLAMQYQQCQ